MITTLVNTSLIKINLQATTKDEVFAELAEMLLKEKRINNKAKFGCS